MRTTLNVPENLLREAMDVTHIKTKTQVITIALEELIRKAKSAELKKHKGAVSLDIDLNTLRDRR